MLAVCKGSNPCPVALTSRAKTCENEFALRYDKYIVQQNSTDDLMKVMEPGCHLVKLCERHPAIDFLVVHNRAGQSSRRLFLIQVSAMKYQNRGADKKVGAVLQTSPVTDGQTPVKFYRRV